MSELTYDDYLQRLSVQDLLRDAGYVRYRRDGMRYPSYVRLDEHGVRVRGDKYIVTQEGRRCFQPPEQRTYNVISLIKSRPELFPEYSVGMNLDLLVNKVCSRLLNTPFEEKERGVREPERETRPFRIDDYEIQGFNVDDSDIRRSFYPYFRHRGIDIRTQIAFRGHFALASHESPDKKGGVYRNLVFPLTVPGGNGVIVGFEERGRYRSDGGSPYKGKAAGSNASTGLWIASPSRTMLQDARRVFLFESAYDAMAFYQLRRDEDKGIGRAVFVSTGGNPTRGQMQGLIRTAPSAVFHLCFDNDEAGRRFAENFMAVAREEKPHSDVAQAFKDTPGHIEVDHEKETALFRLPKDVQQLYFDVEELSEDLRTGYLCDEDKEDLRARIKDGYREFFKAVDGLIVRIERDLPAEGYKDFNDELLAKESVGKRAVGCDLDGDGTVETEESNEENNRYRR